MTIACINSVRNSDGLGVLVLGVMLFRMNFLVFLKILRSFKGLLANLKANIQKSLKVKGYKRD